MNITEAKKIIASMMVFYSNYKPTDVDYAAQSWSEIMEEYTYEQVNAGLKMFMKSDTSGFAPAPGQIIDNIHKLTEPQELNEMEAWSLVSKAIRNSGYNSVEEFVKLPPIVQKAVGLPSQLRTWALDENYNEEVISSNFIKCYRTELARERELQKMPKAVRDMIAKVNKNSYSGQIERKRQEVMESHNERKQREIKALEAKSGVVLMPEKYNKRLEDMKFN